MSEVVFTKIKGLITPAYQFRCKSYGFIVGSSHRVKTVTLTVVSYRNYIVFESRKRLYNLCTLPYVTEQFDRICKFI